MESLAQIDAALGYSVAGLGLLDVNRLHELHSGCHGSDAPPRSRSRHGRGSRGTSQKFARGPAPTAHANSVKEIDGRPRTAPDQYPDARIEIVRQDIHPRKPRAAVPQPGRNMRGI